MNDLMQQMGMDPGIIIESNPMALWVYGSKSVINEIKSIQQR